MVAFDSICFILSWFWLQITQRHFPEYPRTLRWGASVICQFGDEIFDPTAFGGNPGDRIWVSRRKTPRQSMQNIAEHSLPFLPFETTSLKSQLGCAPLPLLTPNQVGRRRRSHALLVGVLQWLWILA